jgi:hypothetical protein
VRDHDEGKLIDDAEHCRDQQPASAVRPPPQHPMPRDRQADRLCEVDDDPGELQQVLGVGTKAAATAEHAHVPEPDSPHQVEQPEQLQAGNRQRRHRDCLENPGPPVVDGHRGDREGRWRV